MLANEIIVRLDEMDISAAAWSCPGGGIPARRRCWGFFRLLGRFCSRGGSRTANQFIGPFRTFKYIPPASEGNHWEHQYKGQHNKQ